MPWGVAAGAAIGIGGSVGSGFLSGNGAKKQMALMRDALNNQRSIDSRTYGDLALYRQFGNDSINAFSRYLTEDPVRYMTPGVTSDLGTYQQFGRKSVEDLREYLATDPTTDPGYAFRLKSGSNAIANNAATAGMLQSGDTLRALNEFGQEMGSQEYGNAFNRYLQKAGVLQGNVGIGQNATGLLMQENDNAFRRYLGKGGLLQGNVGIGQNAVVQGGALANQGASNIGNIAANSDAGAQDRAMAGALGESTGFASSLLMGGKFGGTGGTGGSGFGGFTNAFSNIFKKPTNYQYARFPSTVGVMA